MKRCGICNSMIQGEGIKLKFQSMGRCPRCGFHLKALDVVFVECLCCGWSNMNPYYRISLAREQSNRERQEEGEK